MALISCATWTVACGGSPRLDVQVADDQAATSPGSAPADASGASGGTVSEPPMVAGHAPTGAASGEQQLPPGHPPIDAAGGGVSLPPVAPDSGTGDNALAWKAPADWTAVPPSSSMRRAQYRVPGPAGDAECAVFYFGPGQGGDPMANAERWASQFADENGAPAVATMKTRTEKVGDVEVLLVEAHGTYQAGAMMGGPSEPQPGYALLAAVAEGPDANWFFKMVGPQATIDAQRAEFETMIRSLRSGG